MTTFDATATHVTGELRKVEVNLTQLPRAMDQAGKELEALAAELERAKTAELRCGRFGSSEPPFFQFYQYELCGSGYNSKCTSLKNRKIFYNQKILLFL